MVNLNTTKKQVKQIYAGKIKDSSEVDWLFCGVLKTTKAELITKSTITKKQHNKIIKLAKKRAKGKPLAKLLKEWEFYGFSFKVNCNVLTPRQETEILVSEVIEDFKNVNNKNILDLCTGSGIIAVTLKKHLNANLTASDISKKALKVAKKNAKMNEVEVEFVKSDMFNKLEDRFDAIVSNPPYIKSEDINTLQTEVKDFDPMLALDGGQDGLNFYKEIAKFAPQKLTEGGKIYLELGFTQANQVKKLLQNNFVDIKIVKDYNNIERFIIVTKG